LAKITNQETKPQVLCFERQFKLFLMSCY